MIKGGQENRNAKTIAIIFSHSFLLVYFNYFANAQSDWFVQPWRNVAIRAANQHSLPEQAWSVGFVIWFSRARDGSWQWTWPHLQLKNSRQKISGTVRKSGLWIDKHGAHDRLAYCKFHVFIISQTYQHHFTTIATTITTIFLQITRRSPWKPVAWPTSIHVIMAMVLPLAT